MTVRKNKDKPEEVQIIDTDYSEIMKSNYIDYAMSVIVSRAIPDVRDGLKPVQRRVLFDMRELGVSSDKPYRKSARIVGDTMGKYHPHGDSSIYDSLVVMAQDFKKGQILVDGHGNFGSIEGDGAAAMRYTEARLAPFTEETMLEALENDTVDFVPNFDGTEKEPSVLPSRIPNIMINGAEGIAVGMATSIPPHNMGEVTDALKAVIRNPKITDEKLMKYLPGPDFPTGGIVSNASDLPEIYRTGSGKIRIRGRVHLETAKNGAPLIVITEIPYTMIGMGIAKFIADVENLATNGSAPEITDISNQSSKDGMRIVITLRKSAVPKRTLSILYEKTKLEDTFGVNMLVINNGKPEVLSLAGILSAFADFRFETAKREFEALLKKESDRKEIQDGLIKACDIIDLIIAVIRGSKTRAQAFVCLSSGRADGIVFKNKSDAKAASRLCFTERQSDAILAMRLQSLIGLEIEALEKQRRETERLIEKYRKILSSHEEMAKEILSELEAFRKKYGRERKTEIKNVIKEAVPKESSSSSEARVLMIDTQGYVKTVSESSLEKTQDLTGTDFHFLISSDDRAALFTDKGKVHFLKASEIPFGSAKDKGVPADNLGNIDTSKEKILFAAASKELEKKELLFLTEMGFVKRVSGSEFMTSNRTIASTKLSDKDRVLGIWESSKEIALRSSSGYEIRYPQDEIPIQKKNAVGTVAMKLSAGEKIAEASTGDGKEKSFLAGKEISGIRESHRGRRGEAVHEKKHP